MKQELKQTATEKDGNMDHERLESKTCYISELLLKSGLLAFKIPTPFQQDIAHKK